MRLVLIRHAQADERRPLQRDRTRVLTAEGRRRMRKAARGLRSLMPELTCLAASPYVRARETSDLLAQTYRGVPQHSLPALRPGRAPRDILTWLNDFPDESIVALVGHEPDLGRLAGWLLTGKPAAFVRFRKGAAMLIEFDGAPRAGSGVLAWYLTARQLADLR